MSSDSTRFKKYEKYLYPKFLKVLNNLNLKKESTLFITLIGNDKIKKLNNKYRGKNKVTNVLSFSFINNNEDFVQGALNNILGEVYLAPDFIKKNEDILYLGIHGVLHLCGYDHELMSDFKIMDNFEKKLMRIANTT